PGARRGDCVPLRRLGRQGPRRRPGGLRRPRRPVRPLRDLAPGPLTATSAVPPPLHTTRGLKLAEDTMPRPGLPIRPTFLLSTAFSLPPTAGAAGQEWPRFRGPNGSGVSGTPVPVKWTEKDYRWKVRLPAPGHSSPVLWGDRLFVTCGDEKTGQRLVVCL